jgi:hypothetical protein
MRLDPEQRFFQLEDHYQQHFGPITQPIMHSTDNVEPHIDIYQFPPHGDRDYWTLITGGMSILPQTLRDGTEHYTELFMYVEEPFPWMIKDLKLLAEYPAQNDTFFHWGHTVSRGKDTPESSIPLTAFILLPLLFERADFDTLGYDDAPLHFLWCVPITQQERAYAEEHGGRAFVALMKAATMDIVVDETRKSLI